MRYSQIAVLEMAFRNICIENNSVLFRLKSATMRISNPITFSLHFKDFLCRSIFWHFPPSQWQIVPIWRLYESFIFPDICLHYSVWGQTAQWAPYICPIYALWTKDVKRQHSKASANSKVLDAKLETETSKSRSQSKLFLSFLGAWILLKAANGPILAMMTLRPNSLAVGRTFADNSGLTPRKLTILG